MPHVEHILVPIDLHDNTEPVVAWAALMARTFRSKLTLLHVEEIIEPLTRHPVSQTEPLLGTADNVEAWRKAYRQAAQSTFARLITQYCGGLSVSPDIIEGRASMSILAYLETHPTQLIVMGTHGRPWYQRVVIGSTAEAILRAAPCPVLIVRNVEKAGALPQLRTLLLPTDFSVSGRASEEWAVQLAQDKEVILLHAVENPLLDVYDPDKAQIDLRRIMEESREHPPRSAQPFWDHAHQVAHTKLSALRQQFLGAHAQVEILIREGPATEDILKTAEHRSADLIVMATHGRSGVRRLLLGSITEKVIRVSPCPVLAVRSE